MSLRTIRKLYGVPKLPEPDSDDDFDPHAKSTSSNFKYAGLEVTEEKSEQESDKSDESAEELAAAVDTGKKKKNRKKKKKAKMCKDNIEKSAESEDEVTKSLREVNEILGEMASLPLPSTSADGQDSSVSCTQVEAKHLHSNYEMNNRFGKEVLSGQKKRGRQMPLGFGKKCMIVSMDKYNFKKNGLSMSENRRDGNHVYYTFDHNKDYQKLHKEYLDLVWLSNKAARVYLQDLPEAKDKSHIETILQCSDLYYLVDAHQEGSALLEEVIAYLQYSASPKFDVTDINTHLEYRYLENRPFFVAMLKYMYLLSNRACHRTALEIGKMLLNLDPTDPLAVLMVIDVLALRAREHAWLLDAIGRWYVERDARSLYNIQYSEALAHYHICSKQKVNTDKATALLENAIINFPSVVMYILTYAGQKIDPELKVHPFFSRYSKRTTPKSLDMMTSLYAALVWEKWREQGIMEWLTQTAKTVCDKYIEDLDNLRERTAESERKRMTAFAGLPPQMIRHINVIYPMSDMIADGRVPNLQNTYLSLATADPEPSRPTSSSIPETVNRYGYKMAQLPPERDILKYFSSFWAIANPDDE